MMGLGWRKPEGIKQIYLVAFLFGLGLCIACKCWYYHDPYRQPQRMCYLIPTLVARCSCIESRKINAATQAANAGARLHTSGIGIVVEPSSIVDGGCICRA